MGEVILPKVKVLVTGAAGFIGSHLCERLLEAGCQVIGIDYMKEPNAWSKRRNVSTAAAHPDYYLIEDDLLRIDLKPILDGVQYIIHLAATPGVRTSWGSNFSDYLDNNILATQRLLEAAKDTIIKKFVMASTSSVYGHFNGPANEDRKCKPLSPYGATKLAAEHLARIYHKEFGVPVVILRFFTVYGPRQRPDMAFHKFIRNLLTGKKIIVYGDGGQSRDFTYVSDVVEAIVNSMYYSRSGEIFNIGGNTRASVNNVLKILEESTSKKARVEYLAAQPGEPRETWADIQAAREKISYSPQIVLRDGLAKEIEFIKDLYHI